LCPRCSGAMRLIAFIEAPDIIEKILKHLGLWDVKYKPQSVAYAPSVDGVSVYDDGPEPDDYSRDYVDGTTTYWGSPYYSTQL